MSGRIAGIKGKSRKCDTKTLMRVGCLTNCEWNEHCFDHSSDRTRRNSCAADRIYYRRHRLLAREHFPVVQTTSISRSRSKRRTREDRQFRLGRASPRPARDLLPNKPMILSKSTNRE